MIYTKFHKRRGVSETISTLLILAVTVLGAVFVANFVRDGFFSADQNPSTVEQRANSIQLIGYDTRDSDTLIDVVSLDNDFNQMLCTQNVAPCTVTALTADNVPTDPLNPGTEFIVLKIRNMNVNSIHLEKILVNSIGHDWDQSTSNQDFDGSFPAGTAGTTYPIAGEFSIIPTAEKPLPTRQASTNEVMGDEEVRVIVKLSNNIMQDIAMWDSILVQVNFGAPQPAEFIVLSGDAKW